MGIPKSADDNTISLNHLPHAHAAAALKWLNDMASSDKWNLKADEVCELLGGIPRRTYYDLCKRINNNEPASISRDMGERLSLLLGIWKNLVTIAPQKEIAYQWFSQVNGGSILKGTSIKEYLVTKGDMGSMYALRNYLHGLSI